MTQLTVTGSPGACFVCRIFVPQNKVCFAWVLLSYRSSICADSGRTGVFVVGTLSPVSIASLTMTEPRRSTASQCISSISGMKITSPGTKTVVDFFLHSPSLQTVAIPIEYIMLRKLRWFRRVCQTFTDIEIAEMTMIMVA